MPLSGLNIFIVNPPPEEAKKSSLVEALRRKREDTAKSQILGVLKGMDKKLGGMPTSGHAGGG